MNGYPEWEVMPPNQPQPVQAVAPIALSAGPTATDSGTTSGTTGAKSRSCDTIDDMIAALSQLKERYGGQTIVSFEPVDNAFQGVGQLGNLVRTVSRTDTARPWRVRQVVDDETYDIMWDVMPAALSSDCIPVDASMPLGRSWRQNSAVPNVVVLPVMSQPFDKVGSLLRIYSEEFVESVLRGINGQVGIRHSSHEAASEAACVLQMLLDELLFCLDQFKLTPIFVWYDRSNSANLYATMSMLEGTESIPLRRAILAAHAERGERPMIWIRDDAACAVATEMVRRPLQ